MQRPGNKRIDALGVVARAAFGEPGQRSPVKIGVALGLLLALLTLLGLLIWRLGPRPGLPQLILAAYDQVARPGENVTLCAQVGPVTEESEGLDLSGCELYFQDVRTQQLLARIATGPEGTAALEQSFPASMGPVQVLVRYRGEKQGQRGAQANARIFVWPADARLLVVDADHALIAGDEATLWTVNNLDLHPQPGAARALQKAKEKYHLVYLSAGADRPARYDKLRAWLGMRPKEPFPDGPVLARVCRSAEADPGAFRRAAVADLIRRFPGPAVGVAAGGEEARAFHDAGLRSFLLGKSAEVPDGVTAAKSWQELSDALAK